MFTVSKEVLSEIETVFGELRTMPKDGPLTDRLGSVLTTAFHKKIQIHVVPMLRNTEVFIMRVLPEETVVDKITTAALNNENTTEVIADLWRKCNSFYVEIDGTILTTDFTPRELTSLLLHELGHVVYTNSVPNRISTIMQYGIARASTKTRTTLFSTMFRGLLRVPLIYACSFGNTENLRKELKADRFAVNHGYLKDILSAMDKITAMSKGRQSAEEFTTDATNFIIHNAEQIQERRAALARRNLMMIRNRLGSGYLKESVDLFLHDCLTKDDTVIYEKVDLIQEGVMDNFRKIFSKKLEPITRAQIDYVAAKIEAIKTVDDKIMLLSYVDSKLDLVDYYIAILNDKKASNKYRVPHTMAQLKTIQETLGNLRNSIKEKKLPSTDNYIVYYPAGYEG